MGGPNKFLPEFRWTRKPSRFVASLNSERSFVVPRKPLLQQEEAEVQNFGAHQTERNSLQAHLTGQPGLKRNACANAMYTWRPEALMS